MSLMPNLMDALNSFQVELDLGMETIPCVLNKDYQLVFDEPVEGKKRFSYAKIVRGEVQALSVFAAAEPIKNIFCFNIGYAVNSKYRGLGLGFEAVKLGINELTNGLSRTNVKEFYIEAVIDIRNIPSVKIAERIFSMNGEEVKDHRTKTPCLRFERLIIT